MDVAVDDTKEVVGTSVGWEEWITMLFACDAVLTDVWNMSTFVKDDAKDRVIAYHGFHTISADVTETLVQKGATDLGDECLFVTVQGGAT